MSYKPPFARMRAIKRAAPAKQNIGRTPVVQPKNVEEALAVEEPEVVEEPVVEEPVAETPEPIVEEVVEPEPEVVEEDDDDEPEITLPGVADSTPAPEPENGDDEAVEASMDMKRSELDALAESLGIESPDKLPNKQAVIDAIEEAQGDM